MPRTARAGWLCLLAFTPGLQLPAFDCAGVGVSPGEEIKAQLVASGLTSPVDVTAPPGDTSRLFIVEQNGRIRILRLPEDVLEPVPFLDIRTLVTYGGERGLLGLAFHPDYASNGRFFINYTRAGGATGLETVIMRHEVSAGNPDVANPSGVAILRFDQPYSNHNGGQLVFGPADGYLYISTGDGGDGGDPGNRAQNPLSFLGKLLRIDVDSGELYGIPPTNPFAGRADVLNEIWALGLRNPWRFTFDTETGDLYIADVGQGDWEEVDFQPAASAGGENYEWRVRESNHTYSAGTAYGPGVRRGAIYEYPHRNAAIVGCSITGGMVYRGCAMPELHGAYFFADYCSHWVRTLRVDGSGRATSITDRTADLNSGISPDRLDDISSFGTDARGEIYICDIGGSDRTSSKVFRIVSRNEPLPAQAFTRGDANADQALDLSDAVFSLQHLFLGEPPAAPCDDAVDANDDGELDISDPVYSLNALFGGGAPLPPPLECGQDPTAEGIGCAASTCS